MSGCCEDKSCEVVSLKERHGQVLKAVLAINAVMFGIEAVAGYMARSTALLGDSMDMLGDAMAYGVSLLALSRGPRWNAGAAAFKGFIMAVFGVAVLAEAFSKAIHPVTPEAPLMGIVGLLALTANLLCLGLLWKSRSDDLNMSSVWLCSRNDVLGNLGVLAAAVLVGRTGSRWPDLVVGVAIALVFLTSSTHVLRKSWVAYRRSTPGGLPQG